MIEDLNSGHIMYAFCRVVDTKTSLPKCVLINWQGELAPIVRKGTCANHIRDIERLLKGAHITINARSEEDVEVDLIMEKLARATGLLLPQFCLIYFNTMLFKINLYRISV